MGDFASLAGLHVSPGKVEPAFAPDGRALHISLDHIWIKLKDLMCYNPFGRWPVTLAYPR